MANITFYDQVNDALHNPQMRGALERVSSRLAIMRNAAMASLPDADALRDRARLIRAHTVSKLDHYLSRFADSVERVGGKVHWAASAEEAVQIVLEVARSHQAQLVVKSKSMVTEEIHLNHALESIGVRVIESDLGEYIIQLAGEPPSHIIAPAIHKTKEQIAQLLHEKLKMPMTDDPTAMATFAREKLRQAFLTADIGISGVNFGVAETGTIVTVTNEGNGRMTTSMPRVHVALMGMERLVPSLDDLSVMLQVLARSATGQKLSVYTNLITGARRAGEPDGPDELHVIIVDAGRSQVLAGECAEILYCIRCSACVNVCPVYREIGGHAYQSVYSGPIGAVLTPALWGMDGWNNLPHASSLCGACREVCPVRIDLPRMLLQLRHESEHKNPFWIKAGLRVYREFATKPNLFKLAIAMTRGATRLLTSTEWIPRLPPPLAGWTRHRDFPLLAKRTFSEQLRYRKTIRRDTL
jgi:L-lactate dehydrogenase complex protein LldF